MGCTAVDDSLCNNEIADLQRRLVELDRECASVLSALEQLKLRRAAEVQPTPPSPMVGNVASTTAFVQCREGRAISFALPRSRGSLPPSGGRTQRPARRAYRLGCEKPSTGAGRYQPKAVGAVRGRRLWAQVQSAMLPLIHLDNPSSELGISPFWGGIPIAGDPGPLIRLSPKINLV
jgi:hypothetical protein